MTSTLTLLSTRMQAAVHSTPPAMSTDGSAAEEYRDLEKQLAEWFLKLSIHDQWSKCRLQNGRASSGAHALRPLLTTANRTPHLFPRTLADLRVLDMSSVLALLQAYEHAVMPNVGLDAARRAFARFIGAPVY